MKITLGIFIILFVICIFAVLHNMSKNDEILPINKSIANDTLILPINETKEVNETNESQNDFEESQNDFEEVKERNISITPLNKKLQPRTRTIKSTCTQTPVPEFTFSTLIGVLIITGIGIFIIRK